MIAELRVTRPYRLVLQDSNQGFPLLSLELFYNAKISPLPPNTSV